MPGVTKSKPLFSFLIFSTFFFFNYSHAIQDLQPSSFLEDLNGHYTIGGRLNNNELVDVDKRRSIAENTVNNNSSSLILAANNTYRRDPLNHFNRYSGGWNISNNHYWASVAFTAAPFFIVAAAWFIIYGLSLICTCLYFCCCRSAPYGYSRV